MALDKRLQITSITPMNPKRSPFDPTELEARLAAIEARLSKLEKEEKTSDRRDWAGGA